MDATTEMMYPICFPWILEKTNGSISNIAYLSGGDKSFAKERIEVIGGGRIGIIEDFREVVLSSGGKQQTKRWTQDKGHRAEVAAFAQVVTKGGTSPISWTVQRCRLQRPMPFS